MAQPAADLFRDRARHPLAPLLAVLWAVALGGTLVAVVGAVGAVPFTPPVRPDRSAHEGLFRRGALAYEAGRWDEARRAFEAFLAREPNEPRALDYRDRLDAIAQEAADLARAEEAMAGGRGDEAARLASGVPPNSPLFAQAEALLRVASPSGAVGSDGDGAAALDDLRGVLQQAEALYRDGRFVEAAARARELAAEAEGPAGRALERWAASCLRVGELLGALDALRPDGPPSGFGEDALELAVEALEIDGTLGGAHGRVLRPGLVAAYLVRVRDRWQASGMAAACATWVRAAVVDPREEAWGRWPSRCRAHVRLELDRAAAVRSPGERRRRLRPLLPMLPEGDPLRAEVVRLLAPP